MPKLTGFPKVPLPGLRPIPLLGHMPRVFQFMNDPITVLDALRPMGDVVAVCRDNPAFVCVFGPERNREVLTNPKGLRNDENLFTGPEGSMLNRLNGMIVCINGERHKRHRRLMAPAFSKAVLGGYAEPIVEITETMVERWPREEVVDLDARLRELSLCLAVRSLFGLDMLGGATELGTLTATFSEAATNPLALLLRVDLPGMPYRRALQLGDALLDRLEQLLAEKRRRTEHEHEHDALALLLRAVDDDGSRFTDDELLSEAIALFFAGYETTAKTLSWTMFLLERHPDVLANVLDEIDAALGGRSMTAADIPSLPLLDRVIKESMRLFPAVPTLFMRVVAAEISLGGVTLPPGCNVIISPYATQRDPALYSEPKRFLPERWERIKPSLYEYLPFGAGPRICIGAPFSQQALRLVLPTILQRARVSIIRDARIDRLARANVLTPKYGLPARIEAPHRRRLTPHPVRGNVHDMVALA